MIYRINKKDNDNLAASIGRNNGYNEHSLTFPVDKLESFIFSDIDLNSDVNISYEDYKTDCVIVKEIKNNNSIRYDEYYLNKTEFRDNNFLKELLVKIDDKRISRSSAEIISAYIIDDIDSIDLNNVNITEDEYRDYVFKNSDRIMKYLKTTALDDPRYAICSVAKVLSFLGMVSAIPVSAIVDTNAGMETLIASSLVFIVSSYLKEVRLNTLVYNRLFEIYYNTQDSTEIVRRRNKIS